MKTKIKNAFNVCCSVYCKIQNVLFCFLLLCVLACLVFIYFTVKQNKEKEAARLELPKTSVLEENIKKSPLYTHLEKYGFERLQIHDITSKLDKVMDTRKIRPQDTYMIVTGEDGTFKMLVVTRDLSRYYVAKVGDEFVAGILDIEIKTRSQSAQGSINSSLFASMQEKSIHVPLIISFTDIFSWNIDFNSETRKNDAFALVWEEDYTKTGMVVEQTILAARYSGSFTGENYAYFFDGDYYDETGKITQKMFLKSPISFRGVRITSRFSKSRLHPILRIRRPHYGIDYAAPAGTPVESVADGTVKFAGWKGGFGNYIEVSHANNYVTCYGHLRKMNVKTGQKVKQGSTIASVGSTGLSTGPHLDFRIREGKKYIDFLSMKNRNSATKSIPQEKMAEFQKTVAKYKPMLQPNTKESE